MKMTKELKMRRKEVLEEMIWEVHQMVEEHGKVLEAHVKEERA